MPFVVETPGGGMGEAGLGQARPYPSVRPRAARRVEIVGYGPLPAPVRAPARPICPRTGQPMRLRYLDRPRRAAVPVPMFSRYRAGVSSDGMGDLGANIFQKLAKKVSVQINIPKALENVKKQISGEAKKDKEAQKKASGELSSKVAAFQEQIGKLPKDIPLPDAGTSKVILENPTDRLYLLPDGRRIHFHNERDSDWMTLEDYRMWERQWVAKEYREANQERQGGLARAKVLMAGGSDKEAGEAWLAAKNEIQSIQRAEAKKKGIQRLGAQVTKVLHEKGGILLTVAGTIATVIPVVGWIAGPLLTIAGGALTMYQKAEMAKKIAERRRWELEALKSKWEKGELSDTQYEAAVKTIMETEAGKIKAEQAAEMAKASTPSEEVPAGAGKEEATQPSDTVPAVPVPAPQAPRVMKAIAARGMVERVEQRQQAKAASGKVMFYGIAGALAIGLTVTAAILAAKK